MKVLVLWQEIPERTIPVVMDAPSDSVLRVLRASQWKFINADAWEEDDELSVLFYGKDGTAGILYGPAQDGVTKMPEGSLMTGPFDEVIITGMYL